LKLVREVHRTLGLVRGWKGICDACQIDLEYDEEFVVILVKEDDIQRFSVPIDLMSCPNCSHTIELIRDYKNLDISKEIEKIDKL
jgi:hypothetical protein